MLGQPVGELPVVDDARWSAALTSDSLAALVVWILLLVVLQAAIWPLVRRVFRSFPDRGWGFARLVTILVAAWPVWFLASIEAIAFRAIWCGVVVAVVAVLAWGIPRVMPASELESVYAGPWYRNRIIVAGEAVFWSFFGLFLFYRFINPDSWHTSWGGEKPMEFAHINAILRSPHFPPHDPWYADGTLNYYYYGMYLVAFLMKLTGIPSEIAFNLAQPTVIALLAAGAWSVSTALAAQVARGTRWVIGGGLLGVMFVNVVGNLVAAARVVERAGGDLPPINDFVYWVWDPRQIVPRTINEFPYFTALYADLHAHVVALPITVLVIGLCLSLVLDHRALTLAVLRPRARSWGTAGIASRAVLVALALGTLFVTNAWDVPVYAALVFVSILLATRVLGAWWHRIVIAIAYTAAIGVIAYGVALPFSRNYVARYGELDSVRDPSPLYAIEGHFGVFLLVMVFGLTGILSRMWRNPPAMFHPAFVTTALLGVLLWRWGLAGGSDGTISLIDGLTAGLVTGWLLFAIAFAMPQRLDFGLPSRAVRALAGVAWITVIGAFATDRIALALLFGVGAAAGLLWLVHGPAGQRFTLSLVAAAAFVAAGVELVYLVDDLSGGDFYRMNTVFKFYNAVWVLAALASASLLVRMIQVSLANQAPAEAEDAAVPESWAGDPGMNVPDQAVEPVRLAVQSAREDGEPIPLQVEPEREAERSTHDAPEPALVQEPERRASADRLPITWARAGLVVSLLAILASLAYPLIATGIRLDQHFPQSGRSWTLNALDWMNYGEIQKGNVTLSYAEDRDVIEWFNEEVPGTPVIAEASLGVYMCSGSRISNHTGLPVIIGWDWHEAQQRGWSDIPERVQDLRILYTSADPAEKVRIIEKYRVEYIVVGDLERVYPHPDCSVTDNAAGIDALDGMVGSTLEVAFQAGDTLVFRVIGA